MFSRGALPAFVLSLALAVLAEPAPLIPDPGHIYNEGSTCEIGWTPDPTGLWKTMNIQLMTGNNFQMVPLTSSSSCIFLRARLMIDLCPSLIHQLSPRSMVPAPPVHSAIPVLRYVSLYSLRDLFDSMSCFFFSGHHPRSHLFLPIHLRWQCH